jgi:hypothetical protein
MHTFLERKKRCLRHSSPLFVFLHGTRILEIDDLGAPPSTRKQSTVAPDPARMLPSPASRLPLPRPFLWAACSPPPDLGRRTGQSRRSSSAASPKPDRYSYGYVFNSACTTPKLKHYLVSVKTSGVEIGSKRWSVDCHAALVLHSGGTRWWRPGHRRQDLLTGRGDRSDRALCFSHSRRK